MSETLESPAAEAPPEDIRGSLERAWSDMEAREAPAAEPAADAPEVPRDERGRFAPKTQAEEDADAAANAPQAEPAAKAPAPEGETKLPEGAEKTDEPAKPETATGLEPPKNMSAAEREAFAKAPPDVQAWVVRRNQEQEADYTRKTMEVARYKTVISDFQPVAEMFLPHRQTLRDKGFTPATLIKGWHDTEMSMANPQTAPATVARIMRGYNVTPEAVLQALGVQMPQARAPQQEPGAEGDLAPPNGGPIQLPPELVQHLQSLSAEVNDMKARAAQQQQAQVQQAHHQVMTEIQRFAQEKDASGNPLRPFFADVEDDMALLANAIAQKGGDVPPLHELYDTAVRMNPSTYERLEQQKTAALEAQRQAQARKQAEEARARAGRAQRASAPVRGAPGTGHADPRANGELSRIDQLSEAYDAIASNG